MKSKCPVLFLQGWNQSGSNPFSLLFWATTGLEQASKQRSTKCCERLQGDLLCAWPQCYWCGLDTSEGPAKLTLRFPLYRWENQTEVSSHLGNASQQEVLTLTASALLPRVLLPINSLSHQWEGSSCSYHTEELSQASKFFDDKLHPPHQERLENLQVNKAIVASSATLFL